VKLVLLEYTKILGSEFSPLSFEFIAHVSLLLFGGVVLALIGYKFKGIFGSILLTLAGAAAFLYQNELLRF
jgi:hypothetical protein